MKRRNLVQVVLVFVLAVILYPSSGCQYTPPGEPEGRLLVILSRWGRGSGYELLDLRGRRSDISKTLGVDGVPHRPAAWSPSGDRVAYACGVAEDDLWWIFDVDVTAMTTQKYPLPENGQPYSLTWSADGTSFLFTWGRGYPEPSEIWQLDRVTRQMDVLSQLPVGVGSESWSPDRSQIAFVTSETYNGLVQESGRYVQIIENGDLYVQKVDGTSRKMIYAGVMGKAAWSPDGEIIAFESALRLPGPKQICWMPVRNGEAICLQEGGFDLVWSPDGERIAFSGTLGIRMVDTQTGIVQTLVDLENDEKGAHHLDWSPDGKYLAYDKCYSSEAVDSCEIHVVSSDGKEHRRLTRNKFGDEFPVWQPVISATD